jgi:UDP-3-O-[3-hydroxymyristoyl] N-acetylglucosamine deacetylase
VTSQTTLAGPVEYAGVGIHTGEKGRVRVCPAPADYGIRFLVQGEEVPALAEHVVSTQRCTVLGSPHRSVSVATVEHLMAALYGLGIDNARVEVEGPEVPILDGSVLPFVEGLLSAGVREQDAPVRWLCLSEPIWLRPAEPSQALALPADRLMVTAATDFRQTADDEGSPLRGSCVYSFAFLTEDREGGGGGALWRAAPATGAGPRGRPPGTEHRVPARAERGEGAAAAFARELAPARTFCFQEEVAALLEAGIGLGGSVENTVVITDTGTSTPLRFADEMTRHKTLDLLGDLALVGGRLVAHVIAMRAGHTLHVAMASAIRAQLAAQVSGGGPALIPG